MADPLRKPLEPDITVEPFTQPELPESTADIRRVEMDRRVEPDNRKLADAAESFGSTLGSAVGTIRDKVQSGLQVVKQRSAEKGASAEGLAENIREQAGEVKERTTRRVQQWSSTARRRIWTLRAQVRDFSRERPAETVLAIGGIAMLAGIILRLWRSNRD